MQMQDAILEITFELLFATAVVIGTRIALRSINGISGLHKTRSHLHR